MTLRLTINDEKDPLFLVGRKTNNDGNYLVFLYEIQDGALERVRGHLPELLSFNSPDIFSGDDILLTYQRQQYSGRWTMVRPRLESQDSQSLQFLGFDPDDLRETIRHLPDVPMININLPALKLEEERKATLEFITTLWHPGESIEEFKIKIAAWLAN